MRDMIVGFLSFVALISMGIYTLYGFDSFINFIDGFLAPIILTAPLTVALGVMVLIKECSQNNTEEKHG